MVTTRRAVWTAAAVLAAAAAARAGDDAAKQATRFEYLPVPTGAVVRCGPPTRGHLGGVAAVAVTDDAIVTAGDEGFVHFWDRKTLAHRSVLAMDTTEGWQSPRLAPGGEALAWLGRWMGDGSIKVCRLKPSERPWNPPVAFGTTKGRVRSLTFDARGAYVWWIDSRGVGEAISPCASVPGGAVLSEQDAESGEVVAGSERQIAIAAGTQVVVKIPSLRDTYGKQDFTPHRGEVTALWMSNDAKLVATGSAEGEFGLWRIADRTVAPKPKSAAEAVFVGGEAGGRKILSVALSVDGRLLTVADERRIRIVDARSGAVKTTVFTDDQITSCALSPDARTLVAGLDHRGAVAWDVKFDFSEVSAPRPIGEKPASVDGLALVAAEGADAISAADEGGTVRVWSLAGKLIETVPPTADGWQALSLSRDGSLLLRGDGKSARLERRPAGEAVWTAALAARLPVSFSPDGTQVAVTEGRERLVVLDAATGKEIGRTRASGAWWGSAGRFPRSGDAPLEFVGRDGRVGVAVPGGPEVTSPGASRDGALAVSFESEKGFALHRDGKLESLLGRGGDDWTGSVTSIEFSDDAKRFAAGTSEGNVLVFDVATKKRTHRFADPASGRVNSIVFVPATNRIVTADGIGSVIVWDPKLLPK